nr:MAG TPA: hypothetical protein [Bacteriophage sp.]
MQKLTRCEPCKVIFVTFFIICHLFTSLSFDNIIIYNYLDLFKVHIVHRTHVRKHHPCMCFSHTDTSP